MVSNGESSRRAWICRVEHIVAWVLRGASWDSGQGNATAGNALKLTRFRAGTANEFIFDGPEELREWASAGGPWQHAPPESG